MKFWLHGQTIVLVLDERISAPFHNLPPPSSCKTFNGVPACTCQLDIVDPKSGKHDLIKEQKAIQRRERLINSLGNLTLITGSLNPSLSNSGWTTKRPELLKFSKLNLTQYFHGKDTENWSEEAIEMRTDHLYKQLVQI